MAEVIKYGCIKDAALFYTLKTCGSFEALKPELASVIARCVDIKRLVVEQDQFDTGERMLLNFGHTLAHHDRTVLSLRKRKPRGSRCDRHVSDHPHCGNVAV